MSKLHRLLTGADLHEPKGIDTAPAGRVYMSNGMGSGAWVEPPMPEVPTPIINIDPSTELPITPKGTILVSTGTAWQALPVGDNDQVLAADDTTSTGVRWVDNVGGGSGGSSDNVGIDVEQVAHGFTDGDPVYFDGTSWELAQADSANTLATNLVEVVDVDNFRAVIAGVLGGLSGLTPGDWYFVSESSPGTLTSTEPVTGYSNPVGQALSATTLMVIPSRAQEI